jgi:hypothetical protein
MNNVDNTNQSLYINWQEELSSENLVQNATDESNNTTSQNQT